MRNTSALAAAFVITVVGTMLLSVGAMTTCLLQAVVR